MTDTTQQTPVDLLQTNGQINSKAYIYKRTFADSSYSYVTVIAPNTTTARQALTQQFPNTTVSFLGVADTILQVNG